jgi:predicted nucleotidyltransferase
MIGAMTIRNIPPAMEPAAIARIDERLTAIRNDHDIAIPLAIESGSRAWGFPSPDSDYDCRFIFVRPIGHYLSPWRRRDVVETPLDGDLDVNGWELGKAIGLLAKGNAVVIEWLMSPIVYGADRQFRDEFLDLARRIGDRTLIARHYLHLGERCLAAWPPGSETVQFKKIFYALRPAAVLRWLRCHASEVVAPMHLPTLMADSGLPAALADIVAGLIERKGAAAERGSEPVPDVVAAFIGGELELARDVFAKRETPANPGAREDAETFFRTTLHRLSAAP